MRATPKSDPPEVSIIIETDECATSSFIRLDMDFETAIQVRSHLNEWFDTSTSPVTCDVDATISEVSTPRPIDTFGPMDANGWAKDPFGDAS